jgi:predicted phage terminase large subunit-like protein
MQLDFSHLISQTFHSYVASGDEALSYSMPDNLMDAIPVINPGFVKPLHLRPVTDILTKAHTEKVLVAFTTPPQHFKTATVMGSIPFWMHHNPRLRIGYGTYNQNQANNKILEAHSYVQRVGIKPDPRLANTKDWRTLQGGEINARGREVGFTGLPLDIALLDDLFRNRQEAESKIIRDEAFELLKDVIANRSHERTSIILFFTRWHEDDVIGRINKYFANEFTIIRLPALADGLDALGKNPAPDPVGRQIGEALLPAQRSKETLEKLRDNPATSSSFYSMQQGLPRSSKSKIFRNVFYYEPEDLPTEGYIVVFGFDGAYSTKKSADKSVLIEARYVPSARKLYIVSMLIEKMTADLLMPEVKGRAKHHNVRWRGAGAERGVADMSRSAYQINMVYDQISTDKLANNTAVATEWNLGNVLMPKDAAWLTEEVLDEILNFTGSNKEPDDVVDALGNTHDLAVNGQEETLNADEALAMLGAVNA